MWGMTIACSQELHTAREIKSLEPLIYIHYSQPFTGEASNAPC